MEPYEQGARVPRSEWRQLTAAECAQVQADQLRGCETASVWIVEAPKTVLRHVRHSGMHLITSQEDANRFCDNPNNTEVLASVEAYGRGIAARADGFQMLGLAFRPPGLLTTTVNATRGVRIGLHLDSWDGASIAQRASARNRLCINVGQEDRYLLLVDARIDSIAALLLDPSRAKSQTHGITSLVRKFLETYSDVRVFRVCVRPGEAYIAPTELLPHDSTTLGKREADLTLTVLGYFDGGRLATVRRSG